MTDFILGVFEITIGMSLFIALLLLGLKLFGGKFTAKCRYIIWALVMIRLAIPFSFGLLPTFIEIPIDTELVQSEDLSSVLSENTDPVTSVQPSDPGDVVVTPTTPSTPVFPNVDTANPGSTPILPVTPTVPGDQAESVIPSAPVIETPTEQPVSLRQILDIAGIVYLTGAAIFLVWSLVSYFIYTRKILRSAKAADERTQKIFSTICKKYGMKKQPTLLVASGIHSPAAFGIFRRKIVLPDIAFSENGLVGTLAHEVTHCKRGDLYMKLIELIACSLNWFNPLVHIAAFKCEMEMELSCDEKVLSGSSEAARAAYADVMLDIIRRCRRNRGALTTHFNPKKSAVTARFKNILYGSGKRRGRILIGVCLVLCILAGAFVACQTEDDLTDDHWYAEGYYLKCDNGSDVIVMDADGANPASPCQMTPADDSVSFEGLTDGDRIKVEISMIMTTYPGQTEVYSIEKLSDGERDDIDPAVLDSLRELGWIDAKDENKLPDNFTEFYHEAEAVYALFTGYRSDIYSIGTFSENGAKYRSVDINGYTTLAELRAYCEQYFGSELTDELMSKTVSEQHPLYREHKGKLFRFDGYTAPIGYDVGQNYSMILERVEHDVYTVRIDAIMLENGRDIPAVAYCSYTLSEDGEIRFTSFELMAEKLFEALEQIAVENDPSAFNPDAYAALIPNSSADRLFWHQIAGTDDYLYFCAIRRINSTMTSYTDDPPKDFAIYHINSSKMDALGYIEAKIPADIVYDTVCPVVAMTGFGPMSCKFILQMTDGDRVFYVAFDNFDNLQQHLSFTYRGILSDDEVNALKGKYPVSFDKASKYYMGIPKEQYCFEYQGVQYDLSKIYSEVNGIKEWGHIGKYVVAQGHINPNDSLYVLINTETQKIEYHFVAAVMTYHSEDINTIMYARGGTVASWDGKFLADIVLGPYEYIRKLEYSEDKTQIIVTIETKDSSVRTTTFELAPVDDNTLPGNNDDELALRYKPFSGNVGFTPGDGSVFEKRSQELAEATNAFFNEYANDMASSPPLMYYLIHRMGLSKAEMYDFYSPNLSPSTINYLFIEDVEEAKRTLMTDCAFYCSGKVYSFYEVYEAEMAGKPLFDITASDHAATWWNIYDYLLRQKARDEYGHAHSPYIEYLPYVEKIIKDDFTAITDLADWEKLGLRKEYNATYPFLWNLLSGESDVPEYNELEIKDYSLTRIYDAGGTTIEFTFTVTGDSLHETLPPGTYSWTLQEVMDLYIYPEGVPTNQEEGTAYSKQIYGLDRFEGNSAVEAVNTYLSYMAVSEASPFGEWDPENLRLPYGYICVYYGDENFEISFDELQSLMSEKFGIAVERPPQTGMVHSYIICLYDAESDTVRFADTRGSTPVHKFLDIREEEGVTYVIVQFFADRHRIIPSHKVQYAIGEGDVFLGSEIIQEGHYEPRELR